jgi:ArsR family transcriptional regulator, nickel/cobalt-responsive transcriptional repressor
VARTDDAPLPTPPPSDVVESIADAMFALSSTSRVNILMLLRERPCTVGELPDATGMEQSAVSHQLRVLREHRIVSVERIGRRRRYALHDEDVALLLDAALHHVSGGRAVLRADVG